MGKGSISPACSEFGLRTGDHPEPKVTFTDAVRMMRKEYRNVRTMRRLDRSGIADATSDWFSFLRR
jgi:hypothetical protein